MSQPTSAQIADAIAEALRGIRRANGYYTDVGASVLRGRADVLMARDLPLPCVLLITESVGVGTIRPGLVQRIVTLAVIGVVAADDGYEQLMAAVDADIVAALARFATQPATPPTLHVAFGEEAGAIEHPEQGRALAAVTHRIAVKYAQSV